MSAIRHTLATTTAFRLTVGLLLLPAALTAQEFLSNQSVVDMVVGKLPKDLIIEKIRSSAASYDISTSGLVALNQAKIPKDIIKLMMMAPQGGAADRPIPQRNDAVAVKGSGEASEVEAPRAREISETKSTSLSARSAVRTTKPPLSPMPDEVGIHLRADGMALTFLEAVPFTASKTSNMLGSALTYGLSKAKLKAVIQGSEAGVRVVDPYPEFYFVFEASTASLGGSNQWWGAMTSPNEFTLLKLEKKKAGREVVTGAFGAFSAQHGTDAKAVVPFTLTRIRPGLYRVVPKAALAPGEYAFMPAGVGAQGTAGAQKVFDFGVD